MSMEFVAESGGQEEIILHFTIDADGVDAPTFGNALIAFDGLYRAISGVLNPGLEVEIEFIRSDQGSIQAVLRCFRSDTASLLKRPFLYIVYPILIAVIAGYLTSQDVKVIVNDDSYIVESGHEQIVLPREAQHKTAEAERHPAVRHSIRQFFSVVDSDPHIKGVDFRSPRVPDEPAIPIGREQFALLRDLPEVPEPDLPKYKQETYPRQRVVVVTAVLEGSTTRKWQFLWNGLKIRADIHDVDFFDKLALHEYEFGQGDSLVVDLIADQELNEFVHAYENKGYHVTKVYSHTQGPKQPSMF